MPEALETLFTRGPRALGKTGLVDLPRFTLQAS